MNVIIRPKRGPRPFTVVAHAQGIIKNKSGRRKWGSFPSRAAAEEWRAEVWLCLRRGHDPIVLTQGDKVSYEAAKGVTFGQMVETLAIQWRREDFKYKTLESYLNIAMNRLKPAFGTIPLAYLDSGKIGEYFAQMREAGRHEKTIKNHRSVLNIILEEAKERGLIDENPMPPLPRHRRGRRRASRRKKKFKTWDLDELLRALKSVRTLEPAHAPAISTMALCPLRVNELRGLRWGDLDAKRQHLVVQRTRTTRNVLEELTKSGEQRTLDVPDALLDVLLEHRGSEVLLGRGQETDSMFCEPDGRPMQYDGLASAFRRLREAAGLRPIRFYDLRHGWATIHLRQLRSPVQWVSHQLGHSSISLTVDLYGFTEIDSDLGLANRLVAKKATLDAPETTLEPPTIREIPYVSGIKAPSRPGAQPLGAEPSRVAEGAAV